MFLALFEKMFFCPFAKNEVKAVKVGAPGNVLAKPHGASAAPRGMSATLCSDAFPSWLLFKS